MGQLYFKLSNDLPSCVDSQIIVRHAWPSSPWIKYVKNRVLPSHQLKFDYSPGFFGFDCPLQSIPLVNPGQGN